MKWNTKTIVSDLQTLIGERGTVVTSDTPEGGHYCRDIYIDVKNLEDDGLSIIGFDDGIELSDVDTPEKDITLVEIRNFDSDSDGGVQTSDMQILTLYSICRKYFEDRNVSVIRQLKNYF